MENKDKASSGGKGKMLAHSTRTEVETPKDSTRSQSSSGGNVNMLAHSTRTEVETSKAANPSKLKDTTAQTFTTNPRSSQIPASPVPVHQLPSDHHPNFQQGQLPPSYGHSYLIPGYTYARAVQAPHPYQTRYPSRSPRPSGYEFNQLPNPRISLAPLSSHLNTNTSKPSLQTPISTTTTTNLSTSTTTHGSTLTSSTSVHLLTQKPHLSSPSDELKTSTYKPYGSPSPGLETMTTPSDDGLPRFTQAQNDFTKSQDREFPPLSPHIQRRRDVVKLPPASRLVSAEEFEGSAAEASSRYISRFHAHSTHSRLRKKKPKKHRGGGKNKGK